jgi:PST family polysaccharide transporter
MMLRALLTIGGIQVITMLVLLVRTKTLAVMLGPEYVGVMAVIDKLLAVIAQTVSLSLPFAAVRFLPERWSAGPSEFRDLFTRMRNVVLVLIVAATVGALLVSVFRPATWGEALVPYRDALTVAILGLPVIGLFPFLQRAIAGRLQQNLSMVVGFLHAIVLTIAIVGIWWGGLVGYYAAYVVLGTVLVVGITRLAVKGTGAPATPAAPQRRFAVGLPATMWRFSGALLILAFITPYAALFVHYRMLSEHGAETAGWMQAAIGISLAVRVALGTAHGVFLTPNLNRGGSPEDRMEWANRYQITLCLIAGLAVPPLVLFPGLAIDILYSSAFAPGAIFVMVFVVTEVVGLLSGTYHSLVIALERMRFVVAINLVAQLLIVAGAYQLVGPLGILGAGLAALMAPVFVFFATMIFLHRSYGLRMPGRVAARCGWLLVSLVGAGLIGVSSQEFTWASLLLKALTYALISAGFAVLLTSHERTRIREVLAGWRAN